MHKAAESQFYRIPGNRVIRWSHRSRFRLGLSLIGESPRRLLDYGCGDGTFLTMAASRVETGCGVDINVDFISDARHRSASFANLRFCTISELAVEPWHEQRYDVVTCMETLEHCTDESVELILKQLARLVAPAGRVIISVPVELGIAFLIKWIVRKSAAWSGISAYRYTENYPLPDALRMIFAGCTTVVHRPTYAGRDGLWHTHYGFNWGKLRERVRNHFTIEHTTFSPLAFTRGLMSSQVWFICRLPACSSSSSASIASSPARTHAVSPSLRERD